MTEPNIEQILVLYRDMVKEVVDKQECYVHSEPGQEIVSDYLKWITAVPGVISASAARTDYGYDINVVVKPVNPHFKINITVDVK